LRGNVLLGDEGGSSEDLYQRRRGRRGEKERNRFRDARRALRKGGKGDRIPDDLKEGRSIIRFIRRKGKREKDVVFFARKKGNPLRGREKARPRRKA